MHPPLKSIPLHEIIVKRAGQPGQQMAVFFNKIDFTRAQLGQTDQQDVSHLAFFSNRKCHQKRQVTRRTLRWKWTKVRFCKGVQRIVLSDAPREWSGFRVFVFPIGPMEWILVEYVWWWNAMQWSGMQWMHFGHFASFWHFWSFYVKFLLFLLKNIKKWISRPARGRSIRLLFCLLFFTENFS